MNNKKLLAVLLTVMGMANGMEGNVDTNKVNPHKRSNVPNLGKSTGSMMEIFSFFPSEKAMELQGLNKKMYDEVVPRLLASRQKNNEVIFPKSKENSRAYLEDKGYLRDYNHSGVYSKNEAIRAEGDKKFIAKLKENSSITYRMNSEDLPIDYYQYFDPSRMNGYYPGPESLIEHRYLSNPDNLPDSVEKSEENNEMRKEYTQQYPKADNITITAGPNRMPGLENEDLEKIDREYTEKYQKIKNLLPEGVEIKKITEWYPNSGPFINHRDGKGSSGVFYIALIYNDGKSLRDKIIMSDRFTIHRKNIDKDENIINDKINEYGENIKKAKEKLDLDNID